MAARADLVTMGLCLASKETADGALRLTNLGHLALQGSMDIRHNMLVHVGSVLGIGPFAKVAASYIDVQIELFQDATPSCKPRKGLTAAQRDLCVGDGDVHTAVEWYL